MSTKTKKCPFCSSNKVVKRGRQDGIQTYWCRSCGKRFRSQRKAKNILTGNIFDDFVFRKQTIRELIDIHQLDKKTVVKYHEKVSYYLEGKLFLEEKGYIIKSVTIVLC